MYNSDKQKVPCKPSLLLTDGTTDVAATLWGEAAKRFYFSLEIGGESCSPFRPRGGGQGFASLFAYYCGINSGLLEFACLLARRSVSYNASA